MLNHYAMVIKGLLGPANLLDPMRKNIYQLIMVFLITYTMEAMIKNAYETNFGTAYETYKQVVQEHHNIILADVK